MKSNDLLAKLLGSTDSFETALAESIISEAAGVIVHFIAGLQANQLLDNTERERRLKIVFSRTTLDDSHLREIGEAGAALSNRVLKNALTQLLPPEFRGLIFRRGVVSTSATVEGAEKQALALSELQEESPASGQEGHADFSDVIILSISDDPATKKLLEGAGFTPLRFQTLEDLDGILATTEGICAFLVEASFLRSLEYEQRLALIDKLARFSTFAWLRFEEDGLPVDSITVGEIIAKARCRPSSLAFHELTFRDRASLQERELAIPIFARTRLNSGGMHGLFRPGELNQSELKLLGAAMAHYARERRFNPHAELSQVSTEFLHGGHSGARVALVKIDDFRVPVIVKIDSKDLILDEARRFLTFIHKDNQELKPETHFHGNAALIVFGIIPSVSDGKEQPAPTLESRLSELWYGEMMASSANVAEGDSLDRAVSDAIRRVVQLNKQRCSGSGFSCKANPYLKLLKQMEAAGFDWGFGQAALDKRSAAEEIIKPASESAICHGDAHARNILVRGEEGFLIDYANSGPGHPCCDLVKLEASIYFTRFSQFGTDGELINLQRDLSVSRLTYDQLLSKYPRLVNSQTNKIALKLCVRARDAAGDVLAAHGLKWDHYLAVKLLTAWQSLQIPSLQQALVRGVIQGLSA
jgi:hypothetical protein